MSRLNGIIGFIATFAVFFAFVTAPTVSRAKDLAPPSITHQNIGSPSSVGTGAPPVLVVETNGTSIPDPICHECEIGAEVLADAPSTLRASIKYVNHPSFPVDVEFFVTFDDGTERQLSGYSNVVFDEDWQHFYLLDGSDWNDDPWTWEEVTKVRMVLQ